MKNVIESQEFNSLYLIDFGLSYVSTNIEDKAVDLYVLKRAIISANAKSKEIFDKILESYKNFNSKSNSIIARLNEVEMRGRKKLEFG